MRQAIFPILLLAGARAAAADYGALEPFAFLAGHCWQSEIEETDSTDTHCFKWMYGGKHLRDVHVVRGSGEDYGGESIYSVDGATGQVAFTYWNSLGGMSDGRIEFADGAILAPGEEYVGDDGKPREFESSLRRLTGDSYETRTAERIDGEWRELSRVHFRRVGPATEAGPAARQQSEKLAALEPFIGEWMPHPDDPVLVQRPDMQGKVAHALQWGPRRMYLGVQEIYPVGERAQAISQGIVYWDHVDETFKFVASTAYGWTFEGRYRLLDDGRLERVYEVRYREGDEYIPLPELGGQTRRFRETYKLEGAVRMRSTLELDRDGEWEPFAAGEYSMVRKTP